MSRMHGWYQIEEAQEFRTLAEFAYHRINFRQSEIGDILFLVVEQHQFEAGGDAPNQMDRRAPETRLYKGQSVEKNAEDSPKRVQKRSHPSILLSH